MDSIRIKRGLKAQLPRELPLGELAFCTDTRELYVGMGEGSPLRPVTNTEITEHLAEWKSKYQEVSDQFKTKYDGLEQEYATNLTSVQQSLANKSNVLIEEYKEYAEGNDYSKALRYILDNVVNEKQRTVINLQEGKTYIINERINKRNVTLMGKATIIGKLHVGLDDLSIFDGVSNSWYESMMHCIIDGIFFIPSLNYPEYHTNVDYGITLRNARAVTIQNCYFSTMVYPIRFLNHQGSFRRQHNHRIRVINCTFFCCSYNLYEDNYNRVRTTDELLEHGDVDMQGCFCEETKVQNIALGGLDGFTCFNNVFFAEKQKHNIELYYSPGVHISNNRIFEPGGSGIKLDFCSDFIITGNHIFNSGYIANEPAIDVNGIDPWGQTGVCGIISANVLRRCHGEGIKAIQTINEYGVSNLIITSNFINLLDTTKYTPIKLNGYSMGVSVTNNVSNGLIDVTSAQFALSHSNARQDTVGSLDNANIWSHWTSGLTPSIELKYPSNQRIVITGDGQTLTVTKPSDLKFAEFTYLTIESNGNNCIVTVNELVESQNKQNITLNKGDVAIFIWVKSKFVQIS